ncbi:MAG: DUF4240 domain-containing protein [Agriterribacter sp.]
MKRYFENRKAASKKFWTVAVKNKTLTISFGRIGTLGRTVEKEWLSTMACKAAAEKLIKEKTRKGYTELKAVPVMLSKSTSRFSPINKQSFWKLIDASLVYTNIERQAHYLKKELKKLSKKDIVAFDHIFFKLENAAYSWKLWAAAYTIHGGCSDDGFADFRGWLITRGQLVYERALTKPDSLNALGRKKLEQSDNGEHVLYLASTVYEELYDNDISGDEHAKSFKAKTKPSGAEWKEGDNKVLQKINPLLFQLFENKWIRIKR